MKHFIRGLGVGIVLTALLLCIFYRKQMNDSAVIQKARALGMEFTSDTDKKQGQAVSPPAVKAESKPPDKTTAPVSQPAVTVKLTPQPTTSTPVVTKAPAAATQTAKPKRTAKPKAKPSGGKNSGVQKITIRSGAYSSTVASQLQEAGVIKNAKEFDRYLVNNGYGDRIRVGVYNIPKGAGYSEIARLIAG